MSSKYNKSDFASPESIRDIRFSADVILDRIGMPQVGRSNREDFLMARVGLVAPNLTAITAETIPTLRLVKPAGHFKKIAIWSHLIIYEMDDEVSNATITIDRDEPKAIFRYEEQLATPIRPLLRTEAQDINHDIARIATALIRE